MLRFRRMKMLQEFASVHAATTSASNAISSSSDLQGTSLCRIGGVTDPCELGPCPKVYRAESNSRSTDSTPSLAPAGRFLAITRRTPSDPVEDCRARQTRMVLALILTCGRCGVSDDFAVRVGLPAKSGVGGVILAIAPQIASIAACLPARATRRHIVVTTLRGSGHKTSGRSR